MNRRDVLALLGISGAAVGFSLCRAARGCGQSAEYTEQEFLDIGPSGSETKRELASYYTSPPLREPSERFCAGAKGRGLAFTHVDGVTVLSARNERMSLAAPEGARLILDPYTGNLVIRVYSEGTHEKIFVANPLTGQSEAWGQAWVIEGIEPTPLGLVVSHREFGATPGRLSVLAAANAMRELLQFEWAPTPLCALGTRVVYFLNEAAYTIDVTKPSPPKLMGRLPSNPTAAILTYHGITAIVEQDVWRLLPNGTAFRMFAASDVFALFSQGDNLVVASPSRIWMSDGRRTQTIEAPDANLHYVAPIDGTNDLILCRGPAVYRYSRNTGRTEHIGAGRPKMKLNGATIANDELFTWSSQTWVTTGKSCSRVAPPRDYVIE